MKKNSLQKKIKKLIFSKLGNSLPRLIPLPKKAFPSKGLMKPLKSITTVSGKAYMNMEPNIRKMSRELSRLLQKAQPLEEDCAKICKEMSHHLKQVDTCMEKLTGAIGTLKSTYAHAATKFDFDDFSDMSDIYETLYGTFNEWTDTWKNTTDNFFRNIRMLFTFSNFEEKGLEEVKFLN